MLTNLSNLIKEVHLSNQVVDDELGSLWFIGQWDQIPEWGARHIALTRLLERKVRELQSFPETDNTNHSLSVVIHTLDEASEMIKRLASKVDAKAFTAAIKRSSFNVKGVPSLLHIGPYNERRTPPPYTHEWHLNLGLLLAVYQRTQDDALKLKIRFLALNYLFKASPIALRDIAMDQNALDALEGKLQIGIWNPGISYNRESNVFNDLFGLEIQSALTDRSGNYYSIVDSLDLDDLFKLHFSHFTSDTWVSLRDFLCGIEEPNDYSNHLQPPLLMDCTPLLGKSIYKLKNQDNSFEYQAKQLEDRIEELILNATPQKSDKFRQWLRENMIFICKCSVKNVPILKILPIFQKDGNAERYNSQAYSHLNHFLSQTGMRLGSVRGRLLLSECFPLEELIRFCSGQLVQYSGEGQNVLYFNDKLEITESQVFLRLQNIFQQDSNYLKSLGQPTLQLIKGCLEEITDQKWSCAQANEDLRELTQNCLFRIKMHLSNAEFNQKDFTKFASYMELIHYELLTLLTLFEPFKKANFATIFKDRLDTVIPEALKPHTLAGLSKSAMNTFSGIRTCIDSPQTVFTKGAHFEFIDLLGEKHSFQDLKTVTELENIALYLGEFNHNISLYAENHYLPGDPIEEIELLLNAKGENGRPLTAAIDCTIDYVNSQKAAHLLEHFSMQIQNGN